MNWKMAKAMMRALTEKGKGNGGEIEKAAQSRFKKDINAAAAGNDEATHRAAQEWQGEIEGEIAGTKADKFAESGKDTREEFIDTMKERDTDDALEKSFVDAFDDAAERHGYKKWREESKDAPLDDGFGGDMHDVNRMDAEQRVREEMIRDKHTLSDDEFIDKWFNK